MKSPSWKLTRMAEVMIEEMLEYRVEQMHQSRSWKVREHQGFQKGIHEEGYEVTQAVPWLCCLPLMGSDGKVVERIDVPGKWGRQLLPTPLVKQR